MDDEKDLHGLFHRKGKPGGPSCEVVILPVVIKGANGNPVRPNLIDAGGGSEIELLRTVAQGWGIKWGQDELGWWAAVPRDTIEQHFEQPSDTAVTWCPVNAVAWKPHSSIDEKDVLAKKTTAQPMAWAVWRQDDHGNRFEVSRGHSHVEALRLVAEFEAKGHKQYYWVNPEE
jgi:hypothetical protein